MIGGLLEVAVASNVGIRVDHERIPVRPEVRAVCDHVGIDPYTAISEGTLIATVVPGRADAFVDALGGEGIDAAVIGEILALDEGRKVVIEGREEPLTHPGLDPFWGAFGAWAADAAARSWRRSLSRSVRSGADGPDLRGRRDARRARGRGRARARRRRPRTGGTPAGRHLGECGGVGGRVGRDGRGCTAVWAPISWAGSFARSSRSVVSRQRSSTTRTRPPARCSWCSRPASVRWWPTAERMPAWCPPTSHPLSRPARCWCPATSCCRKGPGRRGDRRSVGHARSGSAVEAASWPLVEAVGPEGFDELAAGATVVLANEREAEVADLGGPGRRRTRCSASAIGPRA